LDDALREDAVDLDADLLVPVFRALVEEVPERPEVFLDFDVFAI
jgi:hypothetical protein